MEISTLVVLGIIAMAAFYVVTIYNGLVNLKHGVSKAWSNIDVLLKQRHDELPKLVETCKQYMQYEQETLEKVIHSPFDYDRQMRVYIPSDVPLPNEKNFTFEIKDFIKELVRRAKGNTFILFTSYSSLNYMYYMLKDELEEEGYDLFIQGMAPRNQIVNMYKMSKKPVLFGTDSFWEGVDVKGDKLSSVIIVKLPFKVPSDPVVEAIIENLNNEGRNAFLEYQIPESIIKFKQGIGRLIRSKDDRGIITILDTRTIKKRYGKLFLDAIPTKNILIKTKDDILYK